MTKLTVQNLDDFIYADDETPELSENVLVACNAFVAQLMFELGRSFYDPEEDWPEYSSAEQMNAEGFVNDFLCGSASDEELDQLFELGKKKLQGHA